MANWIRVQKVYDEQPEGSMKGGVPPKVVAAVRDSMAALGGSGDSIWLNKAWKRVFVYDRIFGMKLRYHDHAESFILYKKGGRAVPIRLGSPRVYP